MLPLGLVLGLLAGFFLFIDSGDALLMSKSIFPSDPFPSVGGQSAGSVKSDLFIDAF